MGLSSLGKVVSFTTTRGTASTELVSQAVFEQVVSGIVKQAVEKLEPVRMAAAKAMGNMRSNRVLDVWDWEGVDALKVDLGQETDE